MSLSPFLRSPTATRLRLCGLLVLLCACHREPPVPGEERDAGTPGPGSLVSVFTHGAPATRTTPREGFAGLKLRHAGELTYVLEISRNQDFTESRRFAAYGQEGQELWRFEERPQERITDFTVHPSGEVSLGVERTGELRDTYDLVRLTAEGRQRVRQRVPVPKTLPGNPFLMRSEPTTGLIDKWLPWLRLEARGEDVVLAFLSFMDVPDGGASYHQLISGVMAARWSEERYEEEWTRIVDPQHSLLQVAWQYDEFHWRDAATQPLLAVDDRGRAVVGRGLTANRCRALARAFQELTLQDCIRMGQRGSMHRYVPFAFTTFSPSGEREGTHVIAPEPLEEFLLFDMALRGSALAVVGTGSVREREDGGSPYYAPSPGAEANLVPYDGYVTVVDVDTGEARFTHQLDPSEGRGDYFAAVRWTEEGLLAVGATGWDRWNSGMSVSLAAEPLLALVPEDGGTVLTRRLATGRADRHTHLLSVEARGASLEAVGLSEAPMTHSGDQAGAPAMTFGGLNVYLR